MKREQKYLDFLAKFGISSAHPGGLPLTKALLANESLSQEDHVLDVGCGTGQTSMYVAKTYGSRVTGVDNHPLMVKQAAEQASKETLPIQIKQADAQHLPFNRATFSFIISESVTVFTDVLQSLKEYHRVLRSDGMLLGVEMTLMDEDAISEQQVDEIKHLYGVRRLLAEQDWINMMTQAGFTSIESLSGYDFLRDHISLEEGSEFKFSSEIDEADFEVWFNHMNVMAKYRDLLSYRIYRAYK
ncbi:class I SAM-dependent methyltransferase [Tuberibacillus sp. Marseille-P3662]|uniref:class I SAM-dependent methyltransferase n=1 Tax=Tuberibacillus sp. Marseille-P3662 TaxID=1965358 RepID=UPI0015938943|nr:class I SAM-dependent methyltransferase [Tuberibacillus sp. Marseille-P3662]